MVLDLTATSNRKARERLLERALVKRENRAAAHLQSAFRAHLLRTNN